ncbi:MAG: PEP-CTERM sorting domain-containing protein [Phycisphaerales bacterium]|jgi:hypothetical protein
MNKMALCGLAVIAGTAGVATAQVAAVDGFTGGSSFPIFYGGSTGDVVGFRFTADVDMSVTDLGILSNDGDGALDSPHMVGIWRNSDQALLGSVMVMPSSTLIGDFRYEAVTPFNLVAGERYTAGALYTADDNDSYFSSPATLDLNGISDTNGVFPSEGSLGFTFPTEDSTNLARLGPNFLWVPAPSSLALLGLGGFVAARRRR